MEQRIISCCQRAIHKTGDKFQDRAAYYRTFCMRFPMSMEAETTGVGVPSMPSPQVTSAGPTYSVVFPATIFYAFESTLT